MFFSVSRLTLATYHRRIMRCLMTLMLSHL